ncbi:TPA: hypothetical protein OTQ05_004974 [Escherichia coli]|nr:hypothetical protein [Escherichia coli]
MMNPVPWLQMTNMISYQGLVRTFPDNHAADKYFPLYGEISLLFNNNGVFSWKEITQ